MNDEPDDAGDEPDEPAAPFGPPAVPVEVRCLHCGEVYDSSRIVLRHDEQLGEPAWCSPTPGCDACGFGFDLLPTDPAYRDEQGGWVEDEDDDDEAFAELDDGASRPLPPADAPDGLPARDDDAARAERRRRLFGEGDAFKDDDIPF